MVTLADDEAPYNETAKVYSGSTLIGEGVLDIHLPVAIYANGGTISEIRYDLNDNVGTDYRLFKLENGPFSNSYQQKFSERTDLAKQLETILKYQNDPRIFAAKAGVISQVSIEAGMETGTGSSSGDVTAFVMYIGGAQKMIISVDELDIHSVSLEQEANISLDAISSEKFSAKVTHISKMGRAEGSITKFEVELTLSPDTRFLIGMNGNAEIITGEAEDVLIIPIEAINEDSTGVFVYTGVEREKTYISTGLSDGEFAEITNGLSEGDDIQYISSVSSNNPFGNMNTMPGPPFGGQGFAGGEPTNDN
jgi:HlyD family secretion protein